MPELRDYPTDPLSADERQWVRYARHREQRSLNVWLAGLLTVIFGSIVVGVVYGIRWENVWRMFQ